MERIKLQKYFTDCAVMSRRAAEKEISEGLVSVNGIRATPGMRIDPEQDIVEYRGKRIFPGSAPKKYILLYKPRGYVTTMSDDRGRPTVAQLTAGVGSRVYPVGRLDMDSEGLLLLTDDGALAERLTHPKHEIPKIYRVSVSGELTDERLMKLGQAMDIDGYRIQPVTVRLLARRLSPPSAQLEMTLYEGRNRQIRKMCDSVGLKVTRLCRTAIGSLSIGTLTPGKWRPLTEDEIHCLKNPDTQKGKLPC